MVEDWLVSDRPDPAYLQWARQCRALFASPLWSQAIVALGAEPKFVWNPRVGQGIQLACFRRGPLRIGVLGFPVAGSNWDAQPDQVRVAAAHRIGECANLDMLRINRSMVAAPEPEMTTARIEVWIDRLAQWDVASSRRLRKDLAFAQRANPHLEMVENALDPSACFSLYEATVGAHGGKVRYSVDYFGSLMRVAEQSNLLRAFGACDRDRALRGFAILAIDGDTGFYLHGGTDAKGKREGVSDVLLASLVGAARDAGCRRLSLMSSPWQQPGLLRYKSKWGDCTGLSVTEDIGYGLLGRAGQKMTRWLARRERGYAFAWLSEQIGGAR